MMENKCISTYDNATFCTPGWIEGGTFLNSMSVLRISNGLVCLRIQYIEIFIPGQQDKRLLPCNQQSGRVKLTKLPVRLVFQVMEPRLSQNDCLDVQNQRLLLHGLEEDQIVLQE